MDKAGWLERLAVRKSRHGWAVFDGDLRMSQWTRDEVWVEGVRARLAYSLSDEAQEWARQILDQKEAGQ